MKHPYVIGLNEIICEENKLHLVFDFVDQDLKGFMAKNKPVAESDIKVSNPLNLIFSKSCIRS